MMCSTLSVSSSLAAVMFVLSLLLNHSVAQTSSFQPELLWSRTLQGSSGKIAEAGLRKGNGIVLAEDEKSLWATTESGRVHRVSLDSITDNPDDDEAVFVPHPIDTSHDTDCRSSVALHHRQDGSVEYALYAVLDVPMSSAKEDMNSRLIALDDGTNQLWTRHIAGVVQGTPVVASNGDRIYVTHNTAEGAVVSVLDAADGSAIVKLEDDRTWDHFEYGPPTLVVDQKGDDRIYWGDSNERGYAVEGRVHELLSTNLTTVDSLRYFSSSTTMAPTFGSDGSMWIGGRDATLHGWSPTSAKPVWTTQLKRSLRNESFPILNRILVADNSNQLFVSSASNSFHCLDGNTGDELWSTTVGTSVYLVGAKYSPADNSVYSIQHNSGTVIRQDASSGDVQWEFDCRDYTSNPTCYNSVEADFVLNRRGTVLYYGDVYGNVNALAAAESSPTSFPSVAPSSTPSSSPSHAPSVAPSILPSHVPSQSPSRAPLDSPVTSSPGLSTSQSPVGTRTDSRSEPTSRAQSSAAEQVLLIPLLIAVALQAII